jgi:hypothetical protein
MDGTVRWIKGTKMVGATDLERYWAKVDLAGPVPAHRPDLGQCWIWMAALDGKGYGLVRFGGRTRRANHVTLDLAGIPVPPGQQRDHLCRVRACVRPSHLQVVAPRDNSMRGDTIASRNARKTHCPSGHPFDEANTYLWHGPKGVARMCKACGRGGRDPARSGLKDWSDRWGHKEPPPRYARP